MVQFGQKKEINQKKKKKRNSPNGRISGAADELLEELRGQDFGQKGGKGKEKRGKTEAGMTRRFKADLRGACSNVKVKIRSLRGRARSCFWRKKQNYN